jgi:hypothetical protein
MRDGHTSAGTKISNLLVLWFVLGICSGTQMRAQEVDAVNVRVDSVDASVHAGVDEARGNTEGTQRVGAKRSSSTTWATHANSGTSSARGKVERGVGGAQSKLAGSPEPATLATGNSGLKPEKNGTNENGYSSVVGGGAQGKLVRAPGADVQAGDGSPFNTEPGASPFGSKQQGLTRSTSAFQTPNHAHATASKTAAKAPAKKGSTPAHGKTSGNTVAKKNR